MATIPDDLLDLLTTETDLAFIDKMSMLYTGSPYFRRTAREVFVITPDHVRASPGRRR
jgi:hypothetical protein